jgi:hypothetical protein
MLSQRVVRVTGPAQMAAHGGNKPLAVFNFGVVLSREAGIVCKPDADRVRTAT